MYKCFLDMDGVLADFVTGACNHYGIEYPYAEHTNEGIWDFVELAGIDASKFWGSLDRDFWTNLPKMPDADEILETVVNFFELPNVAILTSPPGSKRDECIIGKHAWMRKYYPALERRLIPTSLKEFCAHSKSVLIDDYDNNIAKFASNSGHVVLVPRPWNSHYAMKNESVLYLTMKLHNLFNNECDVPPHPWRCTRGKGHTGPCATI